MGPESRLADRTRAARPNLRPFCVRRLVAGCRNAQVRAQQTCRNVPPTNDRPDARNRRNVRIAGTCHPRIAGTCPPERATHESPERATESPERATHNRQNVPPTNRIARTCHPRITCRNVQRAGTCHPRMIARTRGTKVGETMGPKSRLAGRTRPARQNLRRNVPPTESPESPYSP
jgi:hypothetical protein